MLAGPATRLFDYLHAIPKVYEATIRWGVETDNGDPLGRVTFTGDASALTVSQIDDALSKFIGWHEQISPATSAKRINGERAYLKAHRGESVVMPPTRVYLHEAVWREHDPAHSQSRLHLVTRGGYYVRALARDLGRMLGCGAHIAELRRTRIGPWDDPGPARIVELRGRALLPWAACRELTDQEVGQLRRAQPIEPATLQPPEWPLPDGFPDPQTPVLGLHRQRLAFLLRRTPEDNFVAVEEFRGGI